MIYCEQDTSLTWHALQEVFTKYVSCFYSKNKGITSGDTKLKMVIVGKAAYNHKKTTAFSFL